MKEIIIVSSKRDFPVIRSIENYSLIGMINEEDINRIEDKDENRVVADFIDKKVNTVNKNMTGKEALQIMLDQDIERVPVVNEQNDLIGILSIGDIIRGHKKLHEMSETQ
jgi:IMP dehydrogenase